MLKGSYKSVLYALCSGLFLLATPAYSETLIQHIDGINASVLKFLNSSVVGNLMLANEWVAKTQESLSTGAAGFVEDISKPLQDTADWAGEQVSSATNWAGEQASAVGDWASQKGTEIGNWASQKGSDIGDWASETFSIGDGSSSSSSDGGSFYNDATKYVSDFVDGVPGVGFLSGVAGGRKSITDLVGDWGNKGAPSVGLTDKTGVDTGSEESVKKNLSFTNPETMSMVEIQKIRQTFNNVAQEISSTVIATGAANIQNATLYDTLVDKNNKEAASKTAVEIAQESKDLRDDFKNWNGTTSTWLIMTNAALSMDVDRIALESGTTLTDVLSSTNPIGDAAAKGVGGLVGDVAGKVTGALK